MACNKYYLILYSCAILQHKNSKFLYPWALQNWPVFKRNIMKKFWLKFRNHAKFRSKKLFISKECAIFCKTGFVLIRKWCGISCKNSHFVQNHETASCARESTVSWKPSQSGADSPTSSIWHPNLIPPTVREINQGRYKPDAG